MNEIVKPSNKVFIEMLIIMAKYVVRQLAENKLVFLVFWNHL